MADEVRADPAELAQLAEKTLDAAVGVSTAWTEVLEAVTVPVSAFGNLDGSATLGAAYERATERTTETVDVMSTVYEEDADKLYQAAVAYVTEDQDAAGRISDHSADLELRDVPEGDDR